MEYQYNRHYREGFNRVQLNDLYDIEPQLKDVDPDLYLMWNPHTGQHLIMDNVVNTAIMRIPQPGWPALHGGIVNHIKRIHTANGFNASKFLDDADEKRELENDRKSDELAQDFAKEMYRADRKSVNFSGVSA